MSQPYSALATDMILSALVVVQPGLYGFRGRSSKLIETTYLETTERKLVFDGDSVLSVFNRALLFHNTVLSILSRTCRNLMRDTNL